VNFIDPTIGRLSSFATSWKQAQAEKDLQRRRQLKEDRAVLIQNGIFTPSLISVLQEILSRYESNVGKGLTHIEASRLWYRCGLRLSSLKEIPSDTVHSKARKFIRFEDFHRLLKRIITDDEIHYPTDLPEDENKSMDFQVRVLNTTFFGNTMS
jgi:hypothetical protein